MTMGIQNWMASLFLMTLLAIMTQPVNAATKQKRSAPALDVKYDCDAKGSVNITTDNIKKHNYSRIGILGKNGSNQNCLKQPTNVSGDQISLTNCTLNDPIYIYIMKEKSDTIFGGHEFHEYVIRCNIPSGGVLLNATAQIVQEVTPSPSPETKAPSLSVIMSITPTNTTVFIGQELTMEIHLDSTSQVGKLYVLPESCNAFSGASSNGGTGTTPASLELLKKISATTLDHEIMEDFLIADNGSAITTVYAFRFMDSPDVTLQCEVHVCMDKSCAESFKNYASTTPTPNKGRKRRAVEQRLPRQETYIVKAMFTVKEDDRTTSGQASRGVCTIGIIGLILIKPVLFLI